MFARRRLAALVAAVALLASFGTGSTLALSVTGIDLELPSGETVAGRVTDGNGGGIAFAHVGLCAGPDDCAVFEGLADASGDYTIRGVQPGTYLAVAYRPDAPVNVVEVAYYGVGGSVTDPSLASEITVGAGGLTGIDITMPAGLILSGRTLDPDGNPVAGVRVNAFGDFGSGVPILSDATGGYEVVGLASNTSYTLFLEPPEDSSFPMGYAGFGMVTVPDQDGTQITTADADIGDVDITLTRGNSISGHLDGASGEAIGVEALGPFNSHPAVVDGAGDFEVPGVWPGTYQLLFVVDSPEPEDGQFPYGLYNGQGEVLADQNASGVEVDASSGDVTGLSAIVPILPRISGVVSGETGPLASARVIMCEPDLGCAFMTAPGGAYSFVNLPPGSYTIQAGAHGWVQANYPGSPVHVTTSDVSGVDVVLPRGSSISGRITGPSGEPVVGAFAFALPSSRGISELGPGGGETDSNGEYVITGLADDTYKLQVSPALYSGYKFGYWSESGYTDDFEQAGGIVISTAPTIVGASPEPDATGVARGANITMQLSADVTGVSKATFQVRESRTNRLIAGKVTYSAQSDIATFDPTAPLARRTTYVVSVLAGIADLSGNPLPPTTWTFTTGT